MRTKAESYAEARRRIFGEPEPAYPVQSLAKESELTSSDKLGEPENPRGVQLSLDEVPYDREMKWVNEAAGQKPRRNMSKSSPFFRQMSAIAQDNREYAQLDSHYKLLDRRKEEYDSQFRRRRPKGKGQPPQMQQINRHLHQEGRKGKGRGKCKGRGRETGRSKGRGRGKGRARGKRADQMPEQMTPELHAHIYQYAQQPMIHQPASLPEPPPLSHHIGALATLLPSSSSAGLSANASPFVPGADGARAGADGRPL